MARLGKRGDSNMPAMTKDIPEPPIFEYLDLIARHRRGRPATGRNPSATLEPGAARLGAAPARSPKLPLLPALASTWLCPGCGRPLVSAVHTIAPVTMYCTRACKARSEG